MNSAANESSAARQAVPADDDIEHLKRTKLPSRDSLVRREGNRVALGVLGQAALDPHTPAAEITEATGGTGEVTDHVDEEVLRKRIVAAMQGIHDPEIPVNIYDLGLIYGFEVDEERNVRIEMTLTAPACPVAGMLVTQVADRVGEVAGVRTSKVVLTWDPPWTKDLLSEAAKLTLGIG